VKYLALVLLFVSSLAGAVSQAEKDAMLKDIDIVLQSYVDVPTWPRLAPNMLDIDITGYDAVTKAKWLNMLPGWDGNGTAIHYGDMAGAFPINNGVGDYSQKFSNPTCPPIFGVDNGLHYLETCTDGHLEPLPQYGCYTCRMINWQFLRFSVKEMWWRDMEYFDAATLANTTDLGIKGSGAGGSLYNGGAFAEIFEYGDVTKQSPRTGYPGQAYRYDMEGSQGVTLFPGFAYQPQHWYTNEGHVKVPSCPTCADGVIEFKIDGKMVYSRNNVAMGATAITGYGQQLYHGGQRAPAGQLRFKVARIALSTAGWIGPAPELH
jgi:hypothetical protein